MSVASEETRQQVFVHKDKAPVVFSSLCIASEYDIHQVAIVHERARKCRPEERSTGAVLAQVLGEKTTPWTSIFVAGMCGFVQVGQPLYAGFSCMIVGNLMYLALEFLPRHQRFAMLIGRFITGAGSGNMSLLRAYAATASVAKDRARAIAFITGPVALGTTIGPAFQLLFTPIGYPGWHVVGGFRLTMYNASAFFALCMNIMGIIIVRWLFKEVYNGVVEKDATTGKTGLPPFDKIAVALCNLTQFTLMFIVFSIGSPFAMMMFAWTRAESVSYISIVQVVGGALAFGIYLSFISFKLAKHLPFRPSTMVSLALMITFHLVTFSWWFIPGNATVYDSQDNSAEVEQVGCDASRFEWCNGLSPVNAWVFFSARAVCIGLAFPITNITMTTLYSRIIGPRRQGTLQGYFEMSGGIARLVGPVLIRTLYMALGPRWVWLLQIAIISLTLLLWGVFYGRMVPLKMKKTDNC